MAEYGVGHYIEIPQIELALRHLEFCGIHRGLGTTPLKVILIQSTAGGGAGSSTFGCFGFAAAPPPPPNIDPIMSNRGLLCRGFRIPKYISATPSSASSHIPTSLICAA